MNRNKLILVLRQELKQMKWAGCSGDQAMDERWDEAIAAVQNRVDQLLSLDAVETVKETLQPITNVPYYPCMDPAHSFPSHLCIPPGTSYTHICPSCGFSSTVGSPIQFLSTKFGEQSGS